MNPIKDIANYISWKYSAKNNGSGKSMFSIGRKNSIRVNVGSAEHLYSIYKDYGIIFSIVNDIADAIRNTPIWFSQKDKEYIGSETVLFNLKNRKPNDGYKGNFSAEIAFELLVYGKAIIAERDYVLDGKSFFLISNRDISRIKYKQGNFSNREIDFVEYYTSKSGSQKLDTARKVHEISFRKQKETVSDKQEYSCPIVSVRAEIEAYANMIDVLNCSWSDGGARKIISFKTGDEGYFASTQLPRQKQELDDDFKNTYGRNSGDGKYIISQQDVNVADLSIPTQQLDVVASKPALESTICNAFKYPPQLLAIKTGAYKSLTEAEEAFYIRCVSPLANFIFEQLDAIFGTNIIDKGVKIELDYSEYEFFAAMKSKKASAVQTMMQGLVNATQGELISKEKAQEIINNML